MKNHLAVIGLVAIAATASAGSDSLDWGISGFTSGVDLIGAGDLVAFDAQRGVALKVVPNGPINSIPGGAVSGSVDILVVSNGVTMMMVENIPVTGRKTLSVTSTDTTFASASPSGGLGFVGTYNERQSISLSGRLGDAAFSFVGGFNTLETSGRLESESFSSQNSPYSVSGQLQVKLGEYFGTSRPTLDGKSLSFAIFETTPTSFQDVSGRLRNWRGDAVVVETDPSNPPGPSLVTPGGTTNVTTVWYQSGASSPGYVLTSGSNPTRGYSGTFGGYIGVTEAQAQAAITGGTFEGLPTLDPEEVYSTFNARGSYMESYRSNYTPSAIMRIVDGY
ncbi:MAG: hypothetical protein SF028_10610 [Candidatus Sumerlaeia bacterium]|nr:hypothetical protein [Candidatus Sumerlaeia bacterium]